MWKAQLGVFLTQKMCIAHVFCGKNTSEYVFLHNTNVQIHKLSGTGLTSVINTIDLCKYICTCVCTMVRQRGAPVASSMQGAVDSETGCCKQSGTPATLRALCNKFLFECITVSLSYNTEPRTHIAIFSRVQNSTLQGSSYPTGRLNTQGFMVYSYGPPLFSHSPNLSPFTVLLTTFVQALVFLLRIFDTIFSCYAHSLEKIRPCGFVVCHRTYHNIPQVIRHKSVRYKIIIYTYPV